MVVMVCDNEEKEFTGHYSHDGVDRTKEELHPEDINTLSWEALARRAEKTADGKELMRIVDRLLHKLED